MKITPRQIILSWDFLVSIAITVFFAIVLGNSISSGFAKDVYGVGISVLSIVFSVYFAALALIITSGDDDFVHFLEEEGDYTGIIDTFKFSLLVLFCALIYSILIYTFTSYQAYQSALQQIEAYQPEIFLWVFVFSFSYGLFAALRATLDSITYALFRVRFLKSTKTSSKNGCDGRDENSE
jgi:hypothetical protein